MISVLFSNQIGRWNRFFVSCFQCVWCSVTRRSKVVEIVISGEAWESNEHSPGSLLLAIIPATQWFNFYPELDAVIFCSELQFRQWLWLENVWSLWCMISNTRQIGLTFCRRMCRLPWWAKPALAPSPNFFYPETGPVYLSAKICAPWQIQHSQKMIQSAIFHNSLTGQTVVHSDQQIDLDYSDAANNMQMRFYCS